MNFFLNEVRTKVQRILSEPSFTDDAKRISNGMRACGGASYAADLIEKSIGRHGAQVMG